METSSMKNKKTDILILGIGNSGRRDDGLGWAFLDFWEERLPHGWDCEYRYQLQVEDAQLIATYDRVYFIDADRRAHPNGFLFEEIQGHQEESFTSHELSPKMILYLCKSIYEKEPEAFLLGISGEEFQLKNGLSETAIKNLAKAITFFDSEIHEMMQKTFPDLKQFSLN